MIVVEESDGWASDNLVMVSYWWKGSVSTPNPHKAALPTPDSWTSQDQESGGAALSPSEVVSCWKFATACYESRGHLIWTLTGCNHRMTLLLATKWVFDKWIRRNQGPISI